MIYRNAFTNSIRGMKCPTNLHRKRLPRKENTNNWNVMNKVSNLLVFLRLQCHLPKTFSSFQGQMAILERKLQEHVGPPPRSLDSFRCNICVSDSHTPNNCWSRNPWMCPEWYLKKWINSVSPRVRHPSTTARENHSWRYWVNHIIKDEVWCHSWHYLSTVYDKRQELKTEAEEQIQRQEEPAEPINRPQLCDDKASPHSPQHRRTRFRIVTRISDIVHIANN